MGGKGGGSGLERGRPRGDPKKHFVLNTLSLEFWKGDRRGKGGAWQAVGGKGGGWARGGEA